MFEDVTFDVLLERMLDRVPDTMDKREGSIIYDALAPAAIELQLLYIELDTILNESFADTQSREYLVRRASERGLAPKPASPATVKGSFTPTTIEIPTGSRFNYDEINYSVKGKIVPGQYKMECESVGTVGNVIGTLIPIEEIEGLETAQISEVLIPGEDEEDTEDFRGRYFGSFDHAAFGGNIADYKAKVNGIDGVGACKVYRAWNGGGTVKVVIVNSEYKAPSDVLVESVQTAIDPVLNQGSGLGIAPIGHVVTIEGVEDVTINITAEITFSDGQTLASSISTIRDALDIYFGSLCQKWQDSESIVVRVSQIEYAIMGCVGVIDIANTKLNGASTNITLDGDQIPKRGTVNGV